jgi:hypothetical protein
MVFPLRRHEVEPVLGAGTRHLDSRCWLMPLWGVALVITGCCLAALARALVFRNERASRWVAAFGAWALVVWVEVILD